jgi:uncharacterized glyoxalase superfamily protein PhnB
MLRSRPFLMFTGQAEAALALYAEAFADFRLLALQRHPEGPVPACPGRSARPSSCSVAPTTCASTAWTCTISPSAVDLAVRRVFRRRAVRARRALGEGGHWLMPVGDYDFSNRYGWVQDRFGVSWQLSLGQMPDP